MLAVLKFVSVKCKSVQLGYTFYLYSCVGSDYFVFMLLMIALFFWSSVH